MIAILIINWKDTNQNENTDFCADLINVGYLPFCFPVYKQTNHFWFMKVDFSEKRDKLRIRLACWSDEGQSNETVYFINKSRLQLIVNHLNLPDCGKRYPTSKTIFLQDA